MEKFGHINSQGQIVSESIGLWYEKDNIIDFTLPATDGTTGPQWIRRHKQKGIQIGNCAQGILLSKYFKPTIGVVNRIKVLKGVLFTYNKRTTDNICASAYAGTFTQGQRLFSPNAEIACLIREIFTDEKIKEMGLRWIITMHECIKDFKGAPRFLGALRCDSGPWLGARYGTLDRKWSRDHGFAFACDSF